MYRYFKLWGWLKSPREWVQIEKSSKDLIDTQEILFLYSSSPETLYKYNALPDIKMGSFFFFSLKTSYIIHDKNLDRRNLLSCPVTWLPYYYILPCIPSPTVLPTLGFQHFSAVCHTASELVFLPLPMTSYVSCTPGPELSLYNPRMLKSCPWNGSHSFIWLTLFLQI